MIMQKRLDYGSKLALCWRSNTVLDWIWLEYDVEGQMRDWEVVYGMALDYVSVYFGSLYLYNFVS